MDSTAIFEKQHSQQAAVRGVPSLDWRAGQERRLSLIRQWAPLDGARALVDGCGIGMYVRSLQGQGAKVWGWTWSTSMWPRLRPTRRAPACARLPARHCLTPMTCSTWC